MSLKQLRGVPLPKRKKAACQSCGRVVGKCPEAVRIPDKVKYCGRKRRESGSEVAARDLQLLSKAPCPRNLCTSNKKVKALPQIHSAHLLASLLQVQLLHGVVFPLWLGGSGSAEHRRVRALAVSSDFPEYRKAMIQQLGSMSKLSRRKPDVQCGTPTKGSTGKGIEGRVKTPIITLKYWEYKSVTPPLACTCSGSNSMAVILPWLGKSALQNIVEGHAATALQIAPVNTVVTVNPLRHKGQPVSGSMLLHDSSSWSTMEKESSAGGQPAISEGLTIYVQGTLFSS